MADTLGNSPTSKDKVVSVKYACVSMLWVLLHSLGAQGVVDRVEGDGLESVEGDSGGAVVRATSAHTTHALLIRGKYTC